MCFYDIFLLLKPASAQPSDQRPHTFIKKNWIYTIGPKFIFSFPASTVVSCLTKSRNVAQTGSVNAGEEDMIRVVLIKLFILHMRTFEFSLLIQLLLNLLHICLNTYDVIREHIRFERKGPVF